MITSEADRVITLGCDAVAKPGALAFRAESAQQAVEWAARTFRHVGCRVELIVDPAWDAAHPGQVEGAVRGLRAVEHTARVDQQTVMHQGDITTRLFARNLGRVRYWATDMGRPFAGDPVFIVGAGSSLDGNVHLVAEAARRGWVVAVNTSAGAVRDHADVVVCTEHKDVSSGLRLGPRTVHVLDLCAGTENWDVPCELQLGIASHDPPYVLHTLRAGGVPVPWCGTCVAGALSLAYRWGAREIILLGEDLCFLPPDRFYAQGTAFEDIRWEMRPDNLVHFTGHSKAMPPTPAVFAPGIGGDPVLTTGIMIDYALRFAAYTDRIPITNASEVGISIPGTTEQPLSEVLERLPPRPRAPLQAPPLAETGMEVARLRAGLRRVLSASDRDVLSETWNVPLMGGARVRAHLTLVDEGGRDPDERQAFLRERMRTAARDLLKEMG